MTAIKAFFTIILIALLASFFLFSSDKEEVLFTKEKLQHYQLVYEQKIFDFSLNERPLPSYIRLQAALYLRVISIDPDAVRCAVQLQDVNLSLTPDNPKLTSRLEVYYERSVEVLFTPDGRVKSITFPGLESNYVGYRQLLQQLEMVVSSKNRYRVIQDDSLGEYEAQYSWQDKSLHRHKRVYVKVVGSDEVKLYQSNATLTLSTDINWYHHFDLHERIRLLREGKKLLQVQTEISLDYLDSNPTDYAYIDDRDLVAAQEYDVDLYESIEQEAAEAFFSEQNYDLQQLLALIEAAPENIKNYLLLESYLQLHPDMISKLYGPIKEAESRVSRDLIGMLESLQLEASQKLLTVLMQDETVRTLDRTRAIIALAAQQTPTLEVKEGLREMVNTRKDEVNDDLANTALLALGALSHEHQTSMIEDQELIREALGNSDNYNDAKAALLAAKNSGVESYVDSIIPYLSSSDPRLRKRALELLLPYVEAEDVKAAVQERQRVEHEEQIKSILDKADATSKAD